MQKAFLAAVAGAGLLAAGTVSAETGWGLGAKVGTLGYGAEVIKRFTPQLAARVGFNTYSYSDSRTEDDIKYDADLNLRNTTLILDWHPFENGFRLSLGYLFSSNDLELESTSTGTVTIGDSTYSLNGNYVNGDVQLGNGAYVGVGYGHGGAAGWSFTADLGVVLQGTPEVDLTTNITQAGIEEDIRREESNLEDDLDEFDRYPVIAVGASYGF